MGLIRDVLGNYEITGAACDEDILAAAEEILRSQLVREASVNGPADMTAFLRMRIGHLQHEEFHVVWLDHRHRVLSVDKLFTGTIDGASVYPREIVRAALRCNASAAVLAHNHPSGLPDPSAADRNITTEIKSALSLIGVRIIDHIIVTAGECTSFAAHGLL